jgi:hypothetical protein
MRKLAVITVAAILIRLRRLFSFGVLVASVAIAWTLATDGAADTPAAQRSSATAAVVRGPFLITALPSLGRLSWRCDPARTPGLAPGLSGLALNYRAFVPSASQRVTLIAGGRTVLARRVDPGDVVGLPYLRRRVQTVVIRQFTEAGSVRATVTVTFARRSNGTYCQAYQSPAIDVHMTPRH